MYDRKPHPTGLFLFLFGHAWGGQYLDWQHSTELFLPLDGQPCKVTRVCDTGYPQVCLLSRFSLVLTCVGCVERRQHLYSFRHDVRMKEGSMPCPEPVVSLLRYASQGIQMCSQYLHSGDYRPFKVVQGNIITLAHSDEPYMQKCGRFVETRFHELELESKIESTMRLLKTRSHTS